MTAQYNGNEKRRGIIRKILGILSIPFKIIGDICQEMIDCFAKGHLFLMMIAIFSAILVLLDILCYWIAANYLTGLLISVIGLSWLRYLQPFIAAAASIPAWYIVQSLQTLPNEHKYSKAALLDELRNASKPPQVPSVPSNASDRAKALHDRLMRFDDISHRTAIFTSILLYAFNSLMAVLAFKPFTPNNPIEILVNLFVRFQLPQVSWGLFFLCVFSVAGYELSMWLRANVINKKNLETAVASGSATTRNGGQPI